MGSSRRRSRTERRFVGDEEAIRVPTVRRSAPPRQRHVPCARRYLPPFRRCNRHREVIAQAARSGFLGWSAFEALSWIQDGCVQA
jgi:hypothetical protein